MLLLLIASISVTMARGGSHDCGELLLQVDLRNPTQRIYRVREVIPVSAGALTLLYPKWIPGEHSPSGPLEAISGLIVHGSDGEPLQWRRDLEDAFRINLTVPKGTARIELEFELLSPATGGEFGHIVWASDRIEAVEWNQVVFYPAGRAHAVIVKPTVMLPHEWSYATALEIQEKRGDTVEFAPTALDQLVDSPLIAGLNFARFELSSASQAPVRLNLFADDRHELALPDARLQSLRRLMVQAGALFGAPHYYHYDFLLTLSDQLGNFGLEHAQSSDDRAPTGLFQEPDLIADRGFLLPHELVHSWNGKYRRPAGLATPNFNVPMHGDLLWVYEGLTTYLAAVLTARSGLWTSAQFQDNLAMTAADMEHRPGRNWRSLQDTADSGPMIFYSPDEWASQRRGTDFYGEGALLWLDVDTKIRELSGDRRSVDDFARAFFGDQPGTVTVKPYRFEDVVATLNSVQRYDWARFLRDRLDSHGAGAPPGGIERSGWRLVYNQTSSAGLSARESAHKMLDLTCSIGLLLSTAPDSAGRVLDVLWNSPAFNSGFAPGMRVLGVNHRTFDAGRLRQALESARAGPVPSEFVVQNGDSLITLSIDYHEGPRHPHLQRVAGSRDRLADIIAAK
jgi:predicted metalloprotease with PDZ domain